MDFLNLKLTWKKDKIEELINSDEENEYRKTLLDCHKSNKAFNDKVIFTFSAAAIPFLLNYSARLNLYNNYIFFWYVLALILFTVIVLFQIINSILATKGCDHGLNNNYTLSNWFFDKTDKIEIGIIVVFFIAIFALIITAYVDFSLKKGEFMKKQIKVEKLNKAVMTPPKAIREDLTKKITKNNIPSNVTQKNGEK